MSDRELLELAAKAAGLIGQWATGYQAYGDIEFDGLDLGGRYLWNPLVSDGDALRLAVKMRITIEQDLFETKACAYVLSRNDRRHFVSISGNVTREEATRRAIVRAAAEIGKAMS